MAKYMKKLLFLLALVFIMTGCSLRSDEPDKHVLAAERKQVEIDFNESNFQLIGDVCYFTRYEKPAGSELKKLGCYRLKKDEAEELLYTYEEMEGEEFYLICSYVDSEGNWYLLYGLRKDQEERIFLEKRTEEGNVLYQALSETFQETLLQESVMDCAADDQGNFCAITYRGSLLFWNTQGEELKKKTAWDAEEENEDVYRGAVSKGFVNAGDCGIYLYHIDTGSLILERTAFDDMALEKEKRIELSDVAGDAGASIYSFNVTGIYSGYEEGIYLVTEEGLWQYDPKRDELTRLLGWMDEYVNINYATVRQVGKNEEGLIVLSYDQALKKSSLSVIKAQAAEELTGKEVITLGCQDSEIFLDNIKSLVWEYNAQSDRYQIEVVTYGQRNESGITTGAVEELTMALLQGKGPDLFDLSAISMKDYAAKGILEDMTPYLKKSEIELVEAVEQALKIDEKIYALSDQFTFMCIVSPKGYSQNGGLSIQQCMEMSEDYPDSAMINSTNKNILLSLMLNADMDTYIDFQSGTCRFDSEKFIDLLKTVNSWKSNSAADFQMSSADGLYQHQYLLETVSILNMLSYLEVKEAFFDFASVSGYPNQEGDPLYPISFPGLYGINSASANKEGAWDVIRYLLLRQREAQYFPTVKEAFEEELNRELDENGKVYSFYTGEEMSGLSSTDEDREEIREILSHIYVYNTEQQEIGAIISEEAKSVFSGAKTPEQAAEIIQSRVSIYLSEQ